MEFASFGLVKYNWHGALISSIDGKWDIAEHWPDMVEVEVLPGRHDVSITSDDSDLYEAGYAVNLEFTAEPGHTYQADRSNEPVRFWIEDVDTEEIVADISCRRQASGHQLLTDCTR